MSYDPQTSPCQADTLDTSVSPTGSLELLSQAEVERLRGIARGALYELFRRCALAVLNCDDTSDSAEEVYKRYPDFEIEIVQRTRGIKLQLRNAPACAFVDGVIISGIRDHLFAVLRDIVFVSSELYRPLENGAGEDQDDATLHNFEAIRFDQSHADSAEAVKSLVFHVLRNAGLLQPKVLPRLVVCWGGHAISREEYDYSKAVGYQLGLRGLDICTGCGPGAMKGPMKGATIGHAKQRIQGGRYIGISEPGIIAAESPNPIVNHLAVMPDIEKRLEAFVRLGHGIIVFPGGVGTLEEILFLLGTLMDPANAGVHVPVIFTEPASSRGYFSKVDAFLVDTLGEGVRAFYQIIEDDPVAVARAMKSGIDRVARNRRKSRDAYYYNWLLNIPQGMKDPFEVTHASMAALTLTRDLPAETLAVNLRRAFSGIVAGNVKDKGVRLVRQFGPFELRGERAIMDAMDSLLRDFVADGRMKILREQYNPCYTVHPL
ncbi:MAG: LOG family protein [Gammaproteobacteria bacterium]|nr:LOG family protein [Gammaproteobacteria bacterium]|tara:strand:+ start:159 stop:1625 length:1467 start_codon:yes stop_codon:yes gene_type:complete